MHILIRNENKQLPVGYTVFQVFWIILENALNSLGENFCSATKIQSSAFRTRSTMSALGKRISEYFLVSPMMVMALKLLVISVFCNATISLASSTVVIVSNT